MTPRAKNLLFMIMLVSLVCVGILYMIPAPEDPKPPKPHDVLKPPAQVTPVTNASDIEVPPGFKPEPYVPLKKRDPRVEKPIDSKPPTGNGSTTDPDGQPPHGNGGTPTHVDTKPVDPVLPLWDWRMIAEKSGVTGDLYAINVDYESGLGASMNPGCRLMVGQGMTFEVIRYKPDHDEYPHQSLGHKPRTGVLPEKIVNPFELMNAVEKAHQGAIVGKIELHMHAKVKLSKGDGMTDEHVLKMAYPLYEVMVWLGEDRPSAILYFDATTGIDVTDKLAGW